MIQHKYGEAQNAEKIAYSFSGHEFFVVMKNLRTFAPIGEALVVRTNDPDYHFVPRPRHRFEAWEKIGQLLGEKHKGHDLTSLDLLRQDRLMTGKDIGNPDVALERPKGQVMLGLVTTAYVFNVQRPFMASPNFAEPKLIESLAEQFYAESIERIAQNQMTT